MNIGTDFYFDGKRLSSFGLIICSIDDSADGNFSVGSVTELNTSKPPRSSRWNYLGESYSEPLSFEIQIAKLRNAVCCGITQEEERAILKWLKQIMPYKEFYFIPPDPVEDIIYHKAKITDMESIKYGGKIIGYSLTIETNAPFGYSKEKSVSISANLQITLNVDSDERDYIHPRIEIKATESGTVTVQNLSNDSSSSVSNLAADETVTIDKTGFGIYSDLSTHNAIDDFSKTWFKLEDGENIIKVDGAADVTLYYREPRKVGG